MLGKYFASRNATKTLHNVSRLLGDQALTLLDIGSAGGVEPRWKQITSKTSYIGFEPDSRSNLDASDAGKDFASYSLIPAAVWKYDGELSIQLCRKPQVSSHFLPNTAFLGKFPRPERFDVLDSTSVSASRLDSLNIEKCDFIKLDIQGGELAALQGGEEVLRKTFGLEIEVEFLGVYQGQPLFGEVCAYLAAQGFEFIDFTNLCRWDRRVRTGFGQCVFGDALFFKSPDRVKKELNEGVLSRADAMRYFAILALYRRVDLMLACQKLFEEMLRQDNDLNRILTNVIRCSDRELRKIQFLARVFRPLLKILGNNLRLHITY